jgi:hypothetical protein
VKAEEIANEFIQEALSIGYTKGCALADAYLDLLAKYQALEKAASIAHAEIDNFYLKMTQESRTQTIHSEDHDLWYARDVLYAELKKQTQITPDGARNE